MDNKEKIISSFPLWLNSMNASSWSFGVLKIKLKQEIKNEIKNEIEKEIKDDLYIQLYTKLKDELYNDLIIKFQNNDCEHKNMVGIERMGMGIEIDDWQSVETLETLST